MKGTSKLIDRSPTISEGKLSAFEVNLSCLLKPGVQTLFLISLFLQHDVWENFLLNLHFPVLVKGKRFHGKGTAH